MPDSRWTHARVWAERSSVQVVFDEMPTAAADADEPQEADHHQVIACFYLLTQQKVQRTVPRQFPDQLTLLCLVSIPWDLRRRTC